MDQASTSDVLNRLYSVLSRSLPMYLQYARPATMRGDEEASETLQHIVSNQQSLIDRVGSMILQSNGGIHPARFPMFYTGYHDLSYAFLIQKMIEHQQQDIVAIEQCVVQLNMAPMAKALAQECLGTAKGNLDALKELSSTSSNSS